VSKNQSDLDEELNENLDFLEDEEATQISSPKNSGYKNWHFNANHKQIAMFTAAGIIGILIISWIIYPKKHTNTTNNSSSALKLATSDKFNGLNLKSMQNDSSKNNNINSIAPATASGQDLNKNPEPNLSLTQSEQLNVNQTNTQQSVGDNTLSWQELKKSITEENKGSAPLSPQLTKQEQPISIDQKPADTVNNSSEIKNNLPIEGLANNIKQPTNEILPLQDQNKIQASIQELKEVIANITTDLLTNVNQIKELQNNLKDLSRSISNVSTTINNIDAKILNLTSTIDNLSIEIKNLKKHLQDEDADLTATIKQSDSDLFSNSPEYVVHAVIPGRAWLKSSSGQIITVTEGDLLGDYGKIAFIDPTSNIVRTSSGVVFR
jgi:hypothetical protein